MMRRIAVILFCVLICQIVSAQELGYMNKYGYPIPWNITPMALDIQGDVSEVSYINNYIYYKFGDLTVGNNESIDKSYHYNSNGQLEEYRDDVGVIWGLHYDNNGNISSYRGLYPDWIEPVYENGKLSKLRWRGRHYRFFYTNGTITKAVLYNDYGSEFSAWYFQNEDPVKLVFRGETTTYSYKNHKITNINGKDKNETWTYNDKGLVSRITYNISGSYEDYTYEYDTHGNWIKRVRIDRDKDGNINGGGMYSVGKETVRKITYRSGSSTTQNTGSKTTSSATVQNTSSSNSTRCDALLTSFMEYCNQKDWDEAYNPWTVLFKECPECSEYMYIYGEAFVKQQINLVDISERGPWVDTLMMIYDQRIKYFAAKSKIYDEGYLLGRKGFDLFRYRGILRMKEAYDILRKSIDLKGEKSEADVIWCAARASGLLYHDNKMNLLEYTNNYEQYKKLLSLIDCTESEREQVSKELSSMDRDINR